MTTYAITDDAGNRLVLSDDPVECVRRMRRMYADEPRSLRVVRLGDGVLLAAMGKMPWKQRGWQGHRGWTC